MPVFEYKAKDGPAREVEGFVDAPDHHAAIERVHQMGYAPIHVQVKTKKKSDIERIQTLFSSHKISDKQLILFSRHLAGFLRNGIPILKAIQIMHQQENDSRFKKILESISRDLKSGLSLSDALEKYPNQFPSFYTSMIYSGEKSSVLDKSLEILSRYIKRHERTKTVIKQALTYPVFLFFAGFSTVVFILSYVVPKLSDLFDSIGQELPWATRFIIQLGDWMKYGWGFILVFVIVIFLILPGKIKTMIGEERWDSMILKIPFIGPNLFKSDVSRFCRALQMSLSNGIPFLTGLDIATPILKHSNLKNELIQCKEAVKKGARFGKSLAATNTFPSFVTEMISIGEESGNLENMLDEISESYEEDVDDSMKNMTNLIEPIMIVLIGLAIAFVVMAMLMPIFDMNIIG